MTTLYLHIGNHRTATSSIQAFMLANWETLLARGVFHPMRIGRHFAIFNAIFSGKRTVKEVSQDLLVRAAKHPGSVHTIVLSDEDVCMRTDLSSRSSLPCGVRICGWKAGSCRTSNGNGTNPWPI